MLPHSTHVKVANRPAKRKEKRSGDAPVSSSQRFGNQRLDRWAKGICAIRDQDASAIVDGRNGVRICGPAAAAAVKDQIPGTTIEVAGDMDVIVIAGDTWQGATNAFTRPCRIVWERPSDPDGDG